MKPWYQKHLDRSGGHFTKNNMKTKEEIRKAANLTKVSDSEAREMLSNIINSRLILEVLLDIRDLLKPEIIMQDVSHPEK